MPNRLTFNLWCLRPAKRNPEAGKHSGLVLLCVADLCYATAVGMAAMPAGSHCAQCGTLRAGAQLAALWGQADAGPAGESLLEDGAAIICAVLACTPKLSVGVACKQLLTARVQSGEANVLQHFSALD
jgi:hypothetical protein